MLAFGAWAAVATAVAAAFAPITSATAAAAPPTLSVTVFAATFARLTAVGWAAFAAILTLLARTAFAAVAAPTAAVAAASATAAMFATAAITAVALFAFAPLAAVARRRRLGLLAAEKTLEPTHQTARFLRRLGALDVRLLRARFEAPLIAPIAWLTCIARVEGATFARFTGLARIATFAAAFAPVARLEGRAFIATLACGLGSGPAGTALRRGR